MYGSTWSSTLVTQLHKYEKVGNWDCNTAHLCTSGAGTHHWRHKENKCFSVCWMFFSFASVFRWSGVIASNNICMEKYFHVENPVRSLCRPSFVIVPQMHLLWQAFPRHKKNNGQLPELSKCVKFHQNPTFWEYGTSSCNLSSQDSQTHSVMEEWTYWLTFASLLASEDNLMLNRWWS